MSAKYTDRLLKKLIEASQSITPVQKTWMLSKIDTMKREKKEEVFEILVIEQKKLYEINQRKLGLNKVYAAKHKMALNGYNEAIERRQERSLLHELEIDVESLFDTLER